MILQSSDGGGDDDDDATHRFPFFFFVWFIFSFKKINTKYQGKHNFAWAAPL